MVEPIIFSPFKFPIDLYRSIINLIIVLFNTDLEVDRCCCTHVNVFAIVVMGIVGRNGRMEKPPEKIT